VHYMNSLVAEGKACGLRVHQSIKLMVIYDQI
jgi:hypothetical protein